MKLPRSRGAWIGLAVVAALSVLVVVRVVQGMQESEPPRTVEQIREERGVPVTTAAAAAGPLEVWREYNGTVSGVRDAVVRARTNDQITAVLVSVGDAVRQGQVLVRQAGEATAARVRQAEVALRQAQRTVERLRPLHEAGAISEQDWEQAVTQLELARADLAAAGDALALTSPLSGTVTDVAARPGTIPNPGDPLVRVADLSELVVQLRVSSAEAADIQEGQQARVAGGGAVGEVRRVALQADPATRLVEVEIAFPPGARLIPGTLATVQVRVAEREQAVQVPRAAVRDGSVWVVGEDGRVSRRAVTVGLQGTNVVEITSGVQPGERVVVEGAALLSEGARVRVVNGSNGGE